MGAAIDITGQRFGRLVAVRLECCGHRGGKRRSWVFLCDCGREHITTFGVVRSGNTKSCGCLYKERVAKNAKNLSGMRFGRLLVVDMAGLSKKSRRIWNCKCDCGSSVTTNSGDLLSGDSKSCGCLQREWARTHAKTLIDGNRKENPVSKTSQWVNEWARNRRKDPVIMVQTRIRVLLRQMLESLSEKKTGKTFKLLGYTPLQLKIHIERQFISGMGWHNKDKWHIDHIVPLATARTLDDVIALNQLSNLRPLWAVDNMKKKAKREFLI